MSYKEMYEVGKTEDSLISLSAQYIPFEKKGDSVLGRLLTRHEVSSQLGSKTYYQYLFDSDDGLIKFALGRATDNEIGTLLKQGGVYCIEYLGQEKLTGGRKVNRFDIKEIGAPVSDDDMPPGDIPDDVPF